MTLLPIVGRELRVAARRKATIWTRFAAALTALVVGTVLLVANERHLSVPEVGRQLFLALSFLAFGFTLLTGIFLTSDCLCSERRDGTLGLLFLTDLRGYDVVLGKLVATSTVAAYALMAIIPVLGIPLLIGGTNLSEFLRMILVLGVTLLLSLSTGMLASVVCRETKTAMLVTFGIMLTLTGGLFLCAWAISLLAGQGIARFGILVRPSPVIGFLYSHAQAFGLSTVASQFWSSIGCQATLAVVQLGVTTWLLPRSWQQGDVVVRAKPKTPRFLRALRKLPDISHPYYWLSSRELFPGKLAWISLGLLGAFWIGFFVGTLDGNGRGTMLAFMICCFMTFGLHAIVKGMMAVQASRRMSEDRRSGALELLLVTPLPVESILDGQWRALRRQFRPLLWGLTIMNLLLVAGLLGMAARFDMSADSVSVFVTIFVGGGLLLFPDFRAIGWVGMRLGLRGMRHHRAVLGTLLRVLLPPWLLLFLFIFGFGRGGMGPGGVTTFFVIWALVSLGIGQAQAERAKEMLRDCLRQLAAGETHMPIAALERNMVTRSVSN